MLSNDARLALETATETYSQQIDEAGRYLTSRGITKDAAAKHRLGFVSHPMIGHEDMIGRLSIPYVTPSGVVEMRFRSIDPNTNPKYLSRVGAKSHMYNVNAFNETSDYIAICEGEMDAIMASTICGIPAVGVPGAQTWQASYRRAFQDYRKVFILADGDTAGQELAKKIAQAIDVAIVVSMPEGKDVNDIVMAEGPEGLRERIGL